MSNNLTQTLAFVMLFLFSAVLVAFMRYHPSTRLSCAARNDMGVVGWMWSDVGVKVV